MWKLSGDGKRRIIFSPVARSISLSLCLCLVNYEPLTINSRSFIFRTNECNFYRSHSQPDRLQTNILAFLIINLATFSHFGRWDRFVQWSNMHVSCPSSMLNANNHHLFLVLLLRRFLTISWWSSRMTATSPHRRSIWCVVCRLHRNKWAFYVHANGEITTISPMNISPTD